MREYTSKVDKLEEAEQERVTEAKEEKSKPIVMGECLHSFLTHSTEDNKDDEEDEELTECPRVGVHMAVVVLLYSWSQPDDT